eukprot:1389613-Amphidinium_carterae.3
MRPSLEPYGARAWTNVSVVGCWRSMVWQQGRTRSVERFGIYQGKKDRVVDDYSASGMNRAHGWC